MILTHDSVILRNFISHLKFKSSFFVTQLSKSFKETIPKAIISNLLKSVQWDIAKELLKVERIKRATRLKLHQQIDNHCQALCVRSRGKTSVSEDDSLGALEGVKWSNIMQETKGRVPDVLDYIATVATCCYKAKIVSN